jgi:glycine hydroxymethyltransferase
MAERLEHANIIVDCGVRIGACEVTRRGMKETEMLQIAELINRTILDREKPENIKREVAKFCAEFQKVEYCFQK